MTDSLVPRMAPLVPHQVDLQDFAFMPLDVRRLRDSDLATDESPEACWAAVLLWSAAWHQVPAGSIPNNDQWIAKQAGYAARGRIDAAWKNVRDGALRGWVLCSDDRWYHPVVAEKALEAWRSKREHAHRKLCDRLRKENKARELAGEPLHRIPTFDEWNSNSFPPEPPPDSGGSNPHSAGIPPETPLKGQGRDREGTGIGIKETLSSSADDGRPQLALVPAPPLPPPVPHQEVRDAFHRILPTLPRVKGWSDLRRSHLAARWKADPKRQRIEWWIRLFEFASDSPFILGEVPRSGGRKPWCLTLPWLVESEEHLLKVIEGNYHEAQG